jgi:hypothetical protein
MRIMMNKSHPIRTVLVGLFIVLRLLLGTAQVRAEESLDEQLQTLAEEIQKAVKGKSVAIGEFTGPAAAEASGGPGLQHGLILKLKDAGVSVEKDAPFEVKGDYGKATNKRNGREQFKLTVQVIDRQTRDPLVNIPGLFVADSEALIRFLGGSGHADLRKGRDEYNRQVVNSLDDPRVFVDGQLIKSHKDSPFTVAIWSKNNNGFLSPANDKGRAFVKLEDGDVYKVYVKNGSNEEHAAAVSIDGLSMFVLARETRRDGGPLTSYVLGPGKDLLVPGWFITSREAKEFLVVPFGQGLAERLLGSTPRQRGAAAGANETLPLLSSSSKIGTITVGFSKSFRLGGDGPTIGSTADGKSIPSSSTITERQFGPVIDWVSIRYQLPPNQN